MPLHRIHRNHRIQPIGLFAQVSTGFGDLGSGCTEFHRIRTQIPRGPPSAPATPLNPSDPASKGVLMTDLHVTIISRADNSHIVAVTSSGAYWAVAHCGSHARADIVRAALQALADRSPDVLREALVTAPNAAVIPASPILAAMPPNPDEVADWLEEFIKRADEATEIEHTWPGELTLIAGQRTFTITVRSTTSES